MQRKYDQLKSEYRNAAELFSTREKRIRDIVKRHNEAPMEYAKTDEYFMSAAIELAALASEYDDVPIGCVIVRNGIIISAECNGRELTGDATYHAETAAISRASRKLGRWRLTDCTLYVTLEPCPMCAGAIWCSRVGRVVVGAKDAKAGALGSVLNLNSYPLNYKPVIKSGVLEDECRRMLGEFFKKKRSRRLCHTEAEPKNTNQEGNRETGGENG